MTSAPSSVHKHDHDEALKLFSREKTIAEGPAPFKRRAVISPSGRPRPAALSEDILHGSTLHFLELPTDIHEYIILFVQEDAVTVMSLMMVNMYFFGLVRDSLTKLDASILKLPPRIQPVLAVKFPNLLYLKLGHMPPAVMGCVLTRCRSLQELYIDCNQFALRCSGNAHEMQLSHRLVR